jgi:hypothetical protein
VFLRRLGDLLSLQTHDVAAIHAVTCKIVWHLPLLRPPPCRRVCLHAPARHKCKYLSYLLVPPLCFVCIYKFRKKYKKTHLTTGYLLFSLLNFQKVIK